MRRRRRVSTVETLHLMESRCISTEAKLQTKGEEYDALKKDLELAKKEVSYLQKKMAERDQYFLEKFIRL